MIVVSFVLPCFNTGRYVEECVDSLYRQGLRSNQFEIICVNDCSTDNTLTVLEQIASTHPEVRIINHKNNLGSGGAYTTGLKEAKGKYIQFVDSDDFLVDGGLKQIVDLAEQENLEVVQFNLIPVDEKGHIIEYQDLRFNSNINEFIGVTDGYGYLDKAVSLLKYEYLPVPAYRKLYKRSFLCDNLLFFSPTTIGTDCLQNLQMLVKVTRMVHIPSAIYSFRQNGGGVTRSTMTKGKILSAVNNYSMAYFETVRGLFPEKIKCIMQTEYENDTLNYFRMCISLSPTDELFVLKHIKNKISFCCLRLNVKQKFKVLFPYIYFIIRFLHLRWRRLQHCCLHKEK